PSGFDSGDPAEGYPECDGWTMPAADKRPPLWVEINEPIYNVTAPRFDLTPADGGKLRVNLIPNDMGTVDMDGACIEKTARGIVLHRKEGDLNFRKL
ncbi:MAG: hypothetical protein IBJ13_09090, partial [Sphingopyxis sp.]|nr:hypothetical protein [Sphingopyxis sp.]